MKKLLIISSLFALMVISHSAKAQLIYMVGVDVSGCNRTIKIMDASNIPIYTLNVTGGTASWTSPPPPMCLSLTGIDHIEVWGTCGTPTTFGSAGSFTSQTLSLCSGAGCVNDQVTLTVNAPSCGTGSLDLKFDFF